MNSPEDEIPLPSEGVLSDAESAKQLREDMCRQYVEGMKQLRDQLIQSRAANAKMEAQLESVSSALLIVNRKLDSVNASIHAARGLLMPLGNQVTPSVLAIREAIRILT